MEKESLPPGLQRQLELVRRKTERDDALRQLEVEKRNLSRGLNRDGTAKEPFDG